MSLYGSAPGHYLEPGTRLNNIYEIENVVGEGGMGVVYRGRAIETGDPVAIKVIRAEMAGNEAALALFRKEASVLNNLLHEAIVRYYVFTRDPDIDRPYLATEFVDGVSLADIIDRHPLPRADVVALAIRLAEGLQAAHRLGVIHRDISPDNIILPDGDVTSAKIIDFGIARASQFGGKTVIGDSIAGKFDYMSPEQLGLYGGNVTPRSDMYSLGIVLAEAALGRPLDMGGTQAAVIEKRRGVPKLDGIEPRLKALLTHMLEPKPTDRPETMTEIAATARSIAGEAPKKSRRGLAIVAAVVVIVGIVGGVLYGQDALKLLQTDKEDGANEEIVVATAPKLIPIEDANEGGPQDSAATSGDTGAAQSTPPDTGAAGEAANDTAGDDTSLSKDEMVAALGGDHIEPNTPREGPAEEIRLSSAEDAAGGAATNADDTAAPTDTAPTTDTAATTDPAPTTGTGTEAAPPEDTAPTEDSAQTEDAAQSDDTPAETGGDGNAETFSSTLPASEGGDTAAGTGDAGVAEDLGPALSETADISTLTSDPEPATDGAADTAATDTGTDSGAAAPPDTSGGNTDIAVVPTEASETGTVDAGAGGNVAAGTDTTDTGGTEPTDDIEVASIDPQVTTGDQIAPTSAAGISRYINQYDAGQCTYIRATEVSPRHASLEAFGDQVPPFVQFDENFARSMGFEADIGLRLVKPAQCAAVEFLRQLKSAGAEPLGLSLDNDTIRSGFALTGTIDGLGDREVVIVVINEDGRVYPIDAISKREGGTASIHTRISGGPTTLQPHLLMAIAADQIPDAATAQRQLAADYFSALEVALRGKEKDVKAQLAYFKFGG